VHSVEPNREAKEPAKQDEQVLADDAPITLEAVPALHGTQAAKEVAPTSDEYVPAGHDFDN